MSGLLKAGDGSCVKAVGAVVGTAMLVVCAPRFPKRPGVAEPLVVLLVFVAPGGCAEVGAGKMHVGLEEAEEALLPRAPGIENPDDLVVGAVADFGVSTLGKKLDDCCPLPCCWPALL